MNEMKLLVVPIGPEQLPNVLGDIKTLELDLASTPDMVDHVGDWTPVSHQVVGAGEILLLTVLLHRNEPTPDTVADLLG